MSLRPVLAAALLLAVPAAVLAQQPAGDTLVTTRMTPDRQFLEENAKRPGWTVTPSGLQYKIERRAGVDAVRPALTDTVSVHYRGRLIDGTEFDSSYKRGEPAKFQPGRLIRGWQEGIPQMRVGEKWEFAIPAELAYGDRGVPQANIPPGATLLFTVELLEIAGQGTAPGQ